MKRVLIRADGSKEIGMGHIMRSLALARELKRKKIEPVFVVKNSDPKLVARVEKAGFLAEWIKGDPEVADEALQLKKIYEKNSCSGIILDICNELVVESAENYELYVNFIREDIDPYFAIIDDFYYMDFPADLLVDPNAGAEKKRAPQCAKTKCLLGPQYFIFRDNFLKELGKKHAVEKEVRDIVVTFGVSDERSVSVKTARALSLLEHPEKLVVKFVFGLQDKKRERKISKELKGFRGTHSFLYSPKNFASVLGSADIAITAAGLTKYETALLGVPNITVSEAMHQHRLMKDFNALGTTIYLGYGAKVATDGIRETLSKLIGDYSLRKELSSKARKVVDGKGAERIATRIKRDLNG